MDSWCLLHCQQFLPSSFFYQRKSWSFGLELAMPLFNMRIPTWPFTRRVLFLPWWPVAWTAIWSDRGSPALGWEQWSLVQFWILPWIRCSSLYSTWVWQGLRLLPWSPRWHPAWLYFFSCTAKRCRYVLAGEDFPGKPWKGSLLSGCPHFWSLLLTAWSWSY